MKIINIEVQQDHLERLVRTSPINAIAELVWNSLDADATEVHVKIDEGALTKLGTVRIIDNGSGVAHAQAATQFSSLGNSWKAKRRTTLSGRFVHGQKGQGRFKAFSIGNVVTWQTHCEIDGVVNRYSITSNYSNLCFFSISDPVPTSGHGTEVVISDIPKDFRLQADHGAADDIRDLLALYLYQYEDAIVIYDDHRIDPKESIERVDTYELRTVAENGESFSGEISIVEWKPAAQRKSELQRRMMLCLPGNFPFDQLKPGVQARGFNYTAYLSSHYFEKLAETNVEALASLDIGAAALVEAAKNKLREHFRERETQRSVDRVQEWKDAKVYPYLGDPADPVERGERTIFNAVALNLADYSTAFEAGSPEMKRLTFQLLKAAIERGPQSVVKILQSAIELPAAKQDELVELLERASFSAIINAAREVTDRLDFLAALNLLIFDPTSKKQLRERSQLHRIIADHTWIFGEAFHLLSDDEDLTNVLRRHLKILGRDREALAVDAPVLDHEGRVRVVDLMLHRRVPLPRDEEREHLVVELKRPSQKIDGEVISQITDYALAVAKDDRFCHNQVKWTFIAISNEMNEVVQARARQRNKPVGLIEDIETPSVQIWAKTWGQLIQESEGRLKFFKQRLEYTAGQDDAMRYLASIEEKYLSPTLAERVRPKTAA